MIRCAACGTENPPDAAYCAKCARKLDAATQEAVVKRRAEHTATGFRWSLVLPALLVALIILIMIVLLVTHLL